MSTSAHNSSCGCKAATLSQSWTRRNTAFHWRYIRKFTEARMTICQIITETFPFVVAFLLFACLAIFGSTGRGWTISKRLLRKIDRGMM